MPRHLLAALALLAAPAAAEVYTPPPPATVVVAFERESVRPLIVEGLADIATERPVEANDPVRIASISKLVMALTALRLMDEGKVDLDRDVSDYLGWKVRSPYYPDVPVTLAQLMSHRAGLSGAADYIIPLGTSLEAKFADPASWREGVRPGGRETRETLFGAPDPDSFAYSNLGAPLVATVLEAASGERFDQLAERLVFKPLGVKACFNWVGCGPDMAARAVVLYRHTGEVAKDSTGDLPPNCTIPVAEGQACDLESYVPGTNASIFSPQGGVRIGMMDLAKIGQALYRLDDDAPFLRPETVQRMGWAMERTGQTAFFCNYGLHFQLIEHPLLECGGDRLFADGIPRIGHSGEAYGLQSGLWLDPKGDRGFVYFTTQVTPPEGGEDTGGFTAREKALMARALKLVGPVAAP